MAESIQEFANALVSPAEHEDVRRREYAKYVVEVREVARVGASLPNDQTVGDEKPHFENCRWAVSSFESAGETERANELIEHFHLTDEELAAADKWLHDRYGAALDYPIAARTGRTE